MPRSVHGHRTTESEHRAVLQGMAAQLEKTIKNGTCTPQQRATIGARADAIAWALQQIGPADG